MQIDGIRPTPFDSRILYSIRWNGRIVGTSGGPNPELQVRPNIGRVNKSIIGTSADNKGIYWVLQSGGDTD